jgi:DNA-binding MarR family transcriptional regulator
MSSAKMKRYVPLVRQFSARVVLFHEAMAEAVGLHVTDLKVLHILGTEAMTAGQLVERTGLTGPAITAVVDRLLAAGCVTRARDEIDRRRVTVRAVPAKMRELDRSYEPYAAEMSELLSRYSAADFAVIESYLSKTSDLLASHAAKLRTGARRKPR